MAFSPEGGGVYTKTLGGNLIFGAYQFTKPPLYMKLSWSLSNISWQSTIDSWVI